MRLLQRLVLPADHDPDVRCLYVEEPAERAEPLVCDRYSVTVPEGRRLSFCTYFNAFPAGYWRRWSVLSEVVLRVRLRGEASVLVYRSNAKGHTERVTVLDGTGQVTLPLRTFIDGGWYWFEVTGGTGGAVVEEAGWHAGTDRAQGRVTVGVTTYNRPGFCVDQLRAFAGAEDVLTAVDGILVIDQGSDRVEDHPAFPEAAAALGDRLRVLRQGNLGGSGGFARAMWETLTADRSDYVLLLDDDVVAEPEGLRRALVFADLARSPTIVGGQMLDLYNRSTLHAFGEGIEPYRWFYRTVPGTEYRHDFADAPLKTTSWLHRRADVDYNAWWMCLIPVSVLRKIGLALPLFIKWDDAEFGVRARKAGFPTVTLPGAAVWHVPWDDKDDTLDWQAYYHARNRLVAGLLHSPYGRGGNLVKESLLITAKHLLAMQYSTAELICRAIEDVLTGPAHLHATLATRLGEVREVRSRFADAQGAGDQDEFPPVSRPRAPRKGREYTVPEGRPAMLLTAMAGAVRQLRPVEAAARRNPQAAVPHADQKWWLLTQLDSALVSSADGTSVAWYQRDPARYRAQVRRAAALHARLLREWPRLRRAYRAALPELVSPERWAETFDRTRRSASTTFQ